MHGHPAVNRLAHVVNREQGNLHGRQGFHFDAGLAARFDRRRAIDRIRVAFGHQFERHHRECQRMTQGDQIRSFFGGHDARHPRDPEHIPFAVRPRIDHRQGRRRHFDAPFGARAAGSERLAADIHHVGLALLVEMR